MLRFPLKRSLTVMHIQNRKKRNWYKNNPKCLALHAALEPKTKMEKCGNKTTCNLQPQLACTVEKETVCFCFWFSSQSYRWLVEHIASTHTTTLLTVPLSKKNNESDKIGRASIDLCLFPPFSQSYQPCPCQQAAGPAPPTPWHSGPIWECQKACLAEAKGRHAQPS